MALNQVFRRYPLNKIFRIFSVLLLLIVFTIGCEQASDPSSNICKHIALEEPEISTPTLQIDFFETDHNHPVIGELFHSLAI